MTTPDLFVDADILREVVVRGARAKPQLQERNLWTPGFAGKLAEAALQHAGDDREAASAWLALAREILLETNLCHELALVDYAEARLAAMSGELSQAEELLRHAQQTWRELGSAAWLTRSNQGLSQVLTMQGRYAEAEDAIRSSITLTQQADPSQPAVLLALAGAQRNLANVLMFQERHGSALSEYRLAEDYLVTAAQMPDAEISQEELNSELAHIALNRANALTFLDRHAEAEVALLQAIERFDSGDQRINRGRALTNLGRLYLREGRFAAALEQFDRAALDLIGDVPANGLVDADRLRQADELLLEHAAAYIALNLFQEASHALERCEALFRRSEQPFELARTRFTQGLLFLYSRDFSAGRVALSEALDGFTQLKNRFWANRVITALVALDFQENHIETAAAALESLLRDAELDGASEESIRWDVSSLAEARLLHAALCLEMGSPAEATHAVEQVVQGIGLPETASSDMPPIPHIAVRVEHMRGRIALTSGNRGTAYRHLSTAVAIMERQRSTLPLEEIRTAFLDDKTSIYSDLIRAILDTDHLTAVDTAQAFDIAERARSRSLLERIRVTVEDDLTGVAISDAIVQREALRHELHWLYSQMLEDPAKQQNADYLRRLQGKEAALQQYEWRTSALLVQAEPVKLPDLQHVLHDNRQALVYTILRGEVMAFLVDANGARVWRNLCSADELDAAHNELRFQLGRVELGEEYRRRHSARLQRMVQAALGRLYDLLVKPLRSDLVARELFIIPYGPIHLLPVHALWDGSGYLLEQYEFRYAPSASLIVHSEERMTHLDSKASFAGIAIEDEDIPHARAEVLAAARRFADAQTYLDAAASRSGLLQAAAQADILHIATHGLFRPDNSFFSALKLADGWIDVREIYRLPLRSQLVVLSACESGAGEIRGADEVVGLARGFMGAGANSLVVSLWNVHDAASAQLLDRFYETLLSDSGGRRPAAALRSAQLSAIQAQQHPYEWAPFVAIG